ncbi:unnamed protein product, partial [marine sediment metagenome]
RPSSVMALSQTIQLQDLQIRRLKEEKTVALERINEIYEAVKDLRNELEKIITP